MTTLRLILGDQLNPRHRWLQQVDDDTVYVLMEIRQETDYVRHHAQKVLAIFAALRDFARQLREAGHRVRHVAIDDPSNRQTLTGNLDALIAHYRADTVQYQAPDEHRLDAELQAWADAARAQRGLQVAMVDTEHFLTARDGARALFGDSRHWLMERFYRAMRQRHAVLMQPEQPRQPEGGQWNFDHDNRKAWSGQPPAPADWRHPHDHRALWQAIADSGAQTFGDPQAHDCRWPLNRPEALADLQAFVTHALPHFGDFQDALSGERSGRQWRLFHSLLSFALNVKMLHPREVIDSAEAAYRAGQVPLASAEGFIRQILGWREYVRGVYWLRMPAMLDENALDAHAPLPAWYWTGETDMACLREALT
ncbi:MAG: hypothetical protein RI907_1302, partial [Pseudomonadota bacterium]